MEVCHERMQEQIDEIVMIKVEDMRMEGEVNEDNLDSCVQLDILKRGRLCICLIACFPASGFFRTLGWTEGIVIKN